MAEDGSAIYHSHCSACHDAGVGRAPSLEGFKKIEPETVEAALTEGVMAMQGVQLSRDEVRAVSTFVTGKKFGPDTPEQFMCKTAAPPFDKALDGPHWSGWGVDATNDRSQPAAMARLKQDQIPRLKVKWAFGFEGASRILSQPTVAGGRVFVAGTRSTVYSLDALSGCVRWVFSASAKVRTGMSVGKIGSDWAVYFGDMGGAAYALNATTGKLIWKTPVEDFPGAIITGTPTLYGGQLFVPVSSMEEVQAGDAGYECCRFRGSVADLDAETGKLIWKSYTIEKAPEQTQKNSRGVQMWGPSGGAVLSSPTIDPVKRAVYVTDGDSYSDPKAETTDSFLAFSMDTGKLLWSAQMTKGDVFNNGCLIKTSGNCPATVGPDVDFLSSPILVSLPGGARALVAGQKSGMVYAIDPDAQGKILWGMRFGNGEVGWGGAVDDKNVYMAFSGKIRGWGNQLNPDVGGGLSALDLATGKVVWYTPPAVCGLQPGCSPAQSAALTLIPGVVFSGSYDGHLRAYRTSDGQVIGDFDTGQVYKTVNGVKAHGGSMDDSGPVVVDGMLFVESGFGLSGGMAGNVLLGFSVDGK